VYGSHLKQLAATYASAESCTKVAARLAVSPSFVAYWAQKKADPTFHAGSWGGARHFSFSPPQRAALEILLWTMVKANPLCSLAEYVEGLKYYGFVVNIKYVSRVFLQWRWSYKKAREQHVLKYTLENNIYYARYVIAIRDFAWDILKFFDESSFPARELRRQHGWAEKGRALSVAHDKTGDCTYTVTLLTSLVNDPPIFITHPHDGRNDAFDFLAFVIAIIEADYLQPGDMLIGDNASIHKAESVSDAVSAVLDAHHVRLVFLPTYSPELNPCELVFAIVKNWMRHHCGDSDFIVEIIMGFTQVDYLEIVRFYKKCITDAV